jgi:lysozyme
MKKTKKLFSFLTIFIYFLSISGACIQPARAAGEGCYINSTGDLICPDSNKTNPSPVMSSPSLSTLQGHTDTKPDALDPVTNSPLYLSASGNDCERQATVPASSLTASGTTATLKVDTPITMSVGDQIVVAGAEQSEYNGTFTITSISGSQLTYTLAQAPSTNQASGSITARPENVATGQDCIDQMTKQIQDLEDRINQLQEQMSSSMGQIEPAMQSMSLPQQQQYVSCLQNNLNSFLNGGGNGLGTVLGATKTGSSSMFSNLLGGNCAQINPGNSNPTSSDDPGSQGISYLAGKGSCDVNDHSPMTSRSPEGDIGVSSTECTKSATGTDAKSCLKNTAESKSTFNQVVEMTMSREGYRNKAYYDSLGKLTIGIGHLCTGDCHPGQVLSNDQVVALFKQDIPKYWNATLKQQDQLCLNDSCFFTHLFQLNYQLGTGWTSKFTRAWSMMRQGNFSGAAQAFANSKWARQTPVRVKDIQAELMAMKGQKMCDGKVIT